jgi:Fur family transcriptional regulator, peroxide stress response regulator
MNLESRMTFFREWCARKALAVTHQRLVIYRVLASREDHPSPELIYSEVRREIPSISLGTVYKNIKTLTEAGLLREVSLPHESLRVDANLDPHHHLICEKCKSVRDLPEADLGPVRPRRRLPEGFEVHRYRVEVVGLCERCARTEKTKLKKHPTRRTEN